MRCTLSPKHRYLVVVRSCNGKKNKRMVIQITAVFNMYNTKKRLLSLEDLVKLFLQLSRQFRHYVEQIPNETHVGNLKDGRISVLVDGRNYFTILHACQMLNCARDAGAEVQLRRDVLTRLTYLQTIICEAAVNSRPRRADGSTQCIGQRRDERVKLLLRFQASAARNYPVGGG